MAHGNESLISHVSIGTNNFNCSVVFYEKVLGVLGCHRIMAHPGAAAFGRTLPKFWVQTPIDGQPASVGNGVHFRFVATNKELVHAFYDAALAAGGKDEGAPGPRPDYGEPYYGCFVRDPDGHKIEAAFWDFELMKNLGWIQDS